MNIVAIADIDGKKMDCQGVIEIHHIKDKQAYITWKLFNNDTLVASVSDNYYFESNPFSERELLQRVVTKIENYRINRKKVFSNVR